MDAVVQADTLLAAELEYLRSQVFDAFNRLPSWKNHWRMASIILLDQLQIAGAHSLSANILPCFEKSPWSSLTCLLCGFHNDQGLLA